MKNILHTLLLLLLVFCASAVSAQDLKFSIAEFEQDPLDLTAKELNRSDGDGYAYAVIKVTSDIEDDDLSKFNFEFGLIKSVKEMHDGQLWLFVARNAKTVTIRRDGYKPILNHQFPAIREGMTYTMKLRVQPVKAEQRVLQFVVEPKNENAIVRVKPEGSAADFDFWGTVDATGSISQLLVAGAYLYEVSADSYITSQGRVMLTADSSGETFVERVRLTPNFGFLEVDNAHGISGADVYVNEKKVGQVPFHSQRMECRDDYRLMVSKGELYKTYSTTFAIARGETTKVSPSLESNFAQTTIRVGGNAEILLNGASKGRGSWSGPLRAGIYNVECRLPNHVSTTKQITVRPDVSETIVMDAPTPIVGSFFVNSTPAGAKIFIDGKDVGFVTPRLINNVLIGSHTLRFEMANHVTETRNVTIREGETLQMDVALSDVLVNSVSINETRLSLEKGASQTLTATVYPENVNDRSVTWTSSNPSVAMVDSNGKVTAINNGTVAITAASVLDASKKAMCTVTIAGDTKTFTVGGITFKMKLVEAGTFQMGSTSGDSDEKTVHDVTITTNYFIGETEVTQALWKVVMGKNPSRFSGDNNPVEQVSWDDCQKFLHKLNSMTGEEFRMPTEAEWEFAAKGGNKSKGYIYSGSDNINDVAWYDGNSGRKPHEVKSKSPNELGIYDMSGNVYEWCSDWYGSYNSISQINPTGATSGSRRVDRGGSWDSFALYCRAANRDDTNPGSRDCILGLRLALSHISSGIR